MKEYYIKNQGAYLRYQDFPGEGVPILFIHGLGCASSYDFPEVVAQKELLGFRRILIDLLGAGYSDKPQNFDYTVTSHAKYLQEFINHLHISKCIIFGHSLGGAVAIELADLCIDKVQMLILSEANLDPSMAGASSYIMAQFSEDEFVKREFTSLVNDSKEGGNTMWAATLSNWLPSAAYRIAKCAVKGGTKSWRETLYQLPIPKGFIFGENSLPDDDYDKLKQHGIHIETVKSAGHSMAWENPKGLAEAIAYLLPLSNSPHQ